MPHSDSSSPTWTRGEDGERPSTANARVAVAITMVSCLALLANHGSIMLTPPMLRQRLTCKINQVHETSMLVVDIIQCSFGIMYVVCFFTC